MSFKVDNYKDIAIANFAECLKYHNIFERLEDVDIFFRKVGISELITEYKYDLSKTVSNGKYINPNPNENFVYGLMGLMEKLSSNEEVFYRFILELTNKLESRFYVDDDYIVKEEYIEILESMKRNLAVLGYEFSYQYEKDPIFDEETVHFQLRILSDGVLNRDGDISFVIEAMKTYNVGIYKSYKEAISNYSNGNYASCIRTCREVFENIFRSHSLNDNYSEGILNFTGEKAVNGRDRIPKSTQTDIFKYWLGLEPFKTRGKGYDFYKILITFYSFMSSKGGHKGESVEIQDSEALFCLRILEDILIWHYQIMEKINI